MIPLFFTISFIYLVDINYEGNKALKEVIEDVVKKSYSKMLYDGTVTTFFGMNNDYSGVTWTIAVEYWLSGFVYIFAWIIVKYPNSKMFVYTFLFLM